MGGHEQHEPAIGLKDARDLVDRDIDRVDVFERETRHDRIERAVPPGQRLGPRLRVLRSASPPAGLTHLARRGIEARHLGTRFGEVPRDLAFAAADVEHAAGALQMTGRPTAGSGLRTRDRHRR